MKATTLKGLAETYRLPTTSTPEHLEMSFSTVLTFGDYTLVAWHFYRPDHKNYAAAVYRFTTADHTCEGKVELTSIADDQFEDNGHAIAWAIAHAN